MRKQRKLTERYCIKGMTSSNKTMVKNPQPRSRNMNTVLSELPGSFVKDFATVVERDDKFRDALELQAKNLIFFADSEASSLLEFRKIVEVAEDKAEAERMKEKARLEAYQLVIFTLIKSLEYAGVVSLVTRPERIAKDAFNAYDNKKKAEAARKDRTRS